MTELQTKLAALSPEKRALFEKLLAEQGLAENSFPLSLSQRGMWFLEQLRPGNPAYVAPGAIRLRGHLDVPLLRRALAVVVGRHEAIRTTFQLRDGKPRQIVVPHLDIELPEVDLRGTELSEVELEGRVGAEVLGEPFDLAAGPLLRVTLLRLADAEYVLAVAMHHLVSDRWSLGILTSELSTVYEALVAGEEPALPEPGIQYGDYAAWQEDQHAKGVWDDDLAYWRERLAGAPADLGLTTDRPRAAVQGFNGTALPISLPAELMRGLGAIANQRGATTYMALLAVFDVLLHRYTGQQDVVVGVPTAMRSRADIQAVMGYFVNTLPIRTDVSGDDDFGTVLDRVRQSCLDAYAHQDAPFELVVGELNTARDLSRSPVYQVSFSYGRDPVPATGFGGAELRRVVMRSHGAKFDLELQTFDASDPAGGLGGWIEYDTNLFDAATITRMSGHFRRLVEQVVADPDRPVGRLDLLDEDERAALLAPGEVTEWPDGLIHQCVENQASTNPDAEAVRFAGESITYAELNHRANQLANRLRRTANGTDVLIGVAMERSVELVVSLVAVVKAGFAYVPIDPGYPRARLEHMLTDADVPVLLTQTRLRDELPPVSAEVLCVDELDLTAEPGENLDLPITGTDAAYVIYTSGSTGRPKGVVNVHSAIRNRLLWMQDAYRLDGTDRVLQKTPFSFDVSVWEFFWPLMVGATLVVAKPDGHKDPGYLAETIQTEGVTTVHFVPSMLQVFLADPASAGCTGLRRVICSGEALPQPLQQRFFDTLPAQLHNLYGPTEAAIDVTAWACRRDGDPRPVPIGHPIANTRMYVLDRFDQPVPTGVPGELHIGGANLARGYLNRPELTAERFVDDPFVPGERIYRTGDLARFRADGAIEYLGRLDHQVKLRGFRIELGEIESVLAQHDDVREALVLATEHAPGDTRLVAYVSPAADPATLSAYARERLPEYMVPAAIVGLERFPLTPNGKVDRAALPAPSYGGTDVEPVAPGTSLERTIAEQWCAVLGVERVGVNENFFDLGGHSLLMAEVRNRLASLGYELSMVELFQNPTVGSLADHLNRPSGPAADSGGRDRAANRRQSRNRRQQAADRRARARTDG
jgi:amino acid adenylation domain-containing protein